ncbi:MAG: UDP-N-acetylmuramoyl-tripeptide--D-alanyl-D-alanine ligase [Bacteroidetes bacterium]|nr:UDP-N-acetylmuramoyl-tripeptide--D-alanyl-D-alanine ligase [Bacteroidota bacterium]
MSIEELYKIFLAQNQQICTDTRKIEKGAIYFALKGGNFDANFFAQSAIEGGCSYAVVDSQELINDKFIVVADALKTLQDLANFHRKQFKIPVIGITGTNGKTTTKELVGAVLSTQFKVHYTKGNLNNHIGVPLTLLSMTKDAEIAIIEMGANHPYEIEFLCNIAEPDYGMVTNMGKAHLEGFGGFEGVVKTKSEMYDFAALHNGKVFVNAADQLLMKQSARVKQRLLYQNAGFYGDVLALSPYVNAMLHLGKEETEIKTKLFGEHNLINMVAAAAVGREFGVSTANIKKALEEYQPENNRSQIKKSAKGNTLILDAYNANPTSMTMALTAFTKITARNKIAIVGDMLELGEASEAEHKNIIRLLELNKISAFLVGAEFTKCNSAFQSFENSTDLKTFLATTTIADTTFLIKGSRGIKLEVVEEVL